MEIAYISLFGAGLVLAIISFVFGQVFDVGGEVLDGVSDSIGDIGTGSGADLASAAEMRTPAPANLSTMSAGVAGFGAFGYIAAAGFDWPIMGTVVFGLLGFFGSAGALYYIIIVPLSRQQGSVTVKREDFVGLIGEVISEIPAGGFGQIVLTSPASGARVAESATSVDGQSISQGKAVTVTRVTGNSVVVRIER